MDNEKERLKRIREAQIKARDPGSSKIRNYDWSEHAKLAAREKRSNLRELFLSIKYRWRGMLMGFFFGAGLALIMNALLLTDTTRLLALVPILISLVIGFVIGRTLEDPIET
jgi:hypothetical protein